MDLDLSAIISKVSFILPIFDYLFAMLEKLGDLFNFFLNADN